MCSLELISSTQRAEGLWRGNSGTGALSGSQWVVAHYSTSIFCLGFKFFKIKN